MSLIAQCNAKPNGGGAEGQSQPHVKLLKEGDVNDARRCKLQRRDEGRFGMGKAKALFGLRRENRKSGEAKDGERFINPSIQTGRRGTYINSLLSTYPPLTPFQLRTVILPLCKPVLPQPSPKIQTNTHKMAAERTTPYVPYRARTGIKDTQC